ncbi:DUF615 domain-containing protein [Alginatibacterium sediminis]|uniref:DUF615 domain-containing protein n=1 Tax=Alginatibacterium sediminis TaxID=2164068 RepID=A0A420EKY9_9ALTE|nr:ribosome biogenesis factor YjgA [Alginatibacterium sediminis]RKF21358.1 DUF615 domain-containing protein [Alginatibacterium sediminis]
MSEKPFDEPEDEIIWVSKSEMKRESQLKREIAISLIALKVKQVETVPLSAEMFEAVALGRRLQGKHEALRRHLNYMAKLMFHEDLEGIELALRLVKDAPFLHKRKLEELELLSAKVIQEGDAAVEQLLADYPKLERQRIRQITRNTKKNGEEKTIVELTKFLKKELLEAGLF